MTEALVDSGPGPTGSTSAGPPAPEDGPGSQGDEEQPARSLGLLVTGLAMLLSTAAAAWMAAGLFRGPLARPAALVAAGVGVGLVTFSYRTRRPNIVQYLVLPVAVAGGTTLLLTTAGDAPLTDVPRLVSDAVRTGGLGQPPVPFDAGWRFIVAVFFTILGAAGTALAFGLARPNVGVFLPVPVVLAAGLLQPQEGSVATGVIALVLLVAALAIAYGAELARDEATSRPFELRRLLRAVVLLGVLAVGLVALSRADFLFPEPDRSTVTAPAKPEAAAPATDQVLFTVVSDHPGPWRLGVLDVYDGESLLLPPFDRGRLRGIAGDGTVAGAAEHQPTVTATFTLVGMQGFDIPNLPRSQRVDADGFAVAHNPRTGLFRLADRRAAQGMTYTVEAAAAPADEELTQLSSAPAALDPFTEAPAPPPEVADLLDQAPRDGPFERLSFARDALHDAVVTAGQGRPDEVPPSRVAEMLDGDEATPYEITTAEVLLARWAGVPARLGYGYVGGERDGDTFEVRPREGATWLEAYFEDVGWVPFTDVPPRAKANLSEGERQAGADVGLADALEVTLYVPIELQSLRLLYEFVRSWLLTALPFVVIGLVAWQASPAVLKGVRRLRRRRWAAVGGPAARLAVAYGEFRDQARDLNVGEPRATPLEFLRSIERDDEHTELAWLVTRALWGDLRRDLRTEDADASEEMGRSVVRRLRRAQPVTTRAIASSSTASLREPFSSELPNVWPRAAAAPGATPASTGRPARWPRWRLSARAWAAAGVVALLLGNGVALLTMLDTGADDAAGSPAPAGLPDRLVPRHIGDFTTHREPSAEADLANAGADSLVTEGRVFTVRRDGEVQGYLQLAALEPRAAARSEDVREGVLDNVATGRFEPVRRGPERVWTTSLHEQTFQAWFSQDGRWFQVFVAREPLAEAEQIFDAILEYQRDGDASPELPTPSTPPDPRRGGEYL